MKARESKLDKEREGLEGAVARLEAQRAGLDAELAQMRRMLEDAGAEGGRAKSGPGRVQGYPWVWQPIIRGPGMPCPLHLPHTSSLQARSSDAACPTEARCQASHKAAMEAANAAKRLAPLEPRAARLEEAVAAAGKELERVQREVTSHQQAIRRGWE